MEKKEEFDFLKSLVDSLNEAFLKMQESYYKKNNEEFDKSKRIFLKLQKNIQESLNQI